MEDRWPKMKTACATAVIAPRWGGVTDQGRWYPDGASTVLRMLAWSRRVWSMSSWVVFLRSELPLLSPRSSLFAMETLTLCHRVLELCNLLFDSTHRSLGSFKRL